MPERVEVRINRKWYAGDLIRETESGFLIRLDITGNITACSKRQVRRWMRV